MDKTEERYLVYGGAGLLLVILAFSLLNRPQTSAGTVPPPSNAMLNFWQHEFDASTQAAQQKAQLAADSLNTYNANKNALELGLAQLKAETTINLQNATSAKDIAQIQSDAATKAAQLGYSAAQNIAQYQADTAKYAAGQAAYAQAYSAYAGAQASEAQSHAQQQNGVWGAISNVLSSVAGIFHVAIP